MSQARLRAAGAWLIPLRRSAASGGRPDQDGLLLLPALPGHIGTVSPGKPDGPSSSAGLSVLLSQGPPPAAAARQRRFQPVSQSLTIRHSTAGRYLAAGRSIGSTRPGTRRSAGPRLADPGASPSESANCRSQPIRRAPMSVALLVVGICGVVLASLSLGWQAANYVLTGGRVKVRLRVGGLGNGGMVTAPPNSLRANWRETLPHKVPAADRRSDGGQRGPQARYGGQVGAEVRVGNVALPGGRLGRAGPAAPPGDGRVGDLGRGPRSRT